MATISAVVVPAKVLKGGRHKVRISVAHNGQTRYIVTDITIDSEKEFKNGSIVKRPDAAMLNTKLRGILQKCQTAVDEIEYINGLSCPEVVFLINNADRHKCRTLQSVVDEYLDSTRIKPTSVRNYTSIWRNISKYIDGKIICENINHTTITGLEKHFTKCGMAPATVRNNLVFMVAVLNYAKKCGYVQYRIDPFACVTIPRAEVRQAWLSVDEIRKIRDVKLTNKRTIKARDFFMLSYYLGGINMADLGYINFNEQVDTIKYARKKTETKSKQNKYVEFQIPDEAKEIIDHYKQPDGLLAMTDSQRRRCFNTFFRSQLKRLAKATGINHLIYYSARKSFSQHAFDLGVSTAVIDYILGHKVGKAGSSLYSYISVTPAMATEAVRKVLDNLK